MLCAYCQGFDFRSMATEVITNCRDPLHSHNYDNDGSSLFKYHSTMLGVRSAVAEGCSLCSLLWETWLDNSRNWIWGDLFSDDEESNQGKKSADFKSAISNTPEAFRPSLSLGLGQVWKDVGSQMGDTQINRDKGETERRLFRQSAVGVCFEVKGNPESLVPYDEGMVMLGICVKAEDEVASQGLFTLRERSFTPDFDLAKKWLQQCLRNHLCGPSDTIPRLPTRVVDIGQSASDLNLLESKGRHAKYTALSHCWGTSPIWTTTVKNQRLPHYSQLPGNFRDSITVTRMLGLKYLWIDSLCVLQDSTDDWEIECANMANIYRNAEVTISVRDNTSSNPGGFLQDVGCKPFKSCQLDDGLTISNQQTHWPSKLCPIPFGSVDRRGWILQEKLLSRRLLHFSKQIMCWQCCGYTYFDGLHHSIPASAWSGEGYVRKLALDQLEKRENKNMYSYWYEIVHDYSGRQLTKPIDKFPALSGLALVFGGVLKDTYLAGLWKNDFVWGLCWRSAPPWYFCPGQKPASTSSEDYSQTRAKEWIAPSWSWASCTRCVIWAHRVGSSATEIYQERLSVQRVCTHSKGHDPYGVIDSASLTAVGKMKSAFIELDFCFDAASGGNLGPVCFDNRITDVGQLGNAPVVEINTVGRGLVRFAQVSLLLVVTTGFDLGIKEPKEISRFYFHDICLILIPGEEKNAYRRVGLLWRPKYVISAEPDSIQEMKHNERWSKDNIIRYPWFDDAKEQEVVII